MRELIANLVSVAALCIALGSSFVFAVRHNAVVPAASDKVDQSTIAQPLPSTLATSAPTPVASVPPPAMTSVPAVPNSGQDSAGIGRESFKNRGCSTCHSIAGTGNPHLPLDGVGSRWTAEQLHAWVTGSGFAAERLPASVARRKQQYTRIPQEEMDALIGFLSDLKTVQRGK